MQKFSDGDFIIVLLYVDDMLVVGHNTCRIQKLKQELSKSFAMKDLGPARQILGMQIDCDTKSQEIGIITREVHSESTSQIQHGQS